MKTPMTMKNLLSLLTARPLRQATHGLAAEPPSFLLEDGGDAEVYLKAFNITPARPLPEIVSILGLDNRDVAKNMKEAVACLDKRIAILHQTPEIRNMHRQWAN